MSAGNVTSASGAAPPVVVLGLVAFGRFTGRELPHFSPAGRAPSQCPHVTVSHASTVINLTRSARSEPAHKGDVLVSPISGTASFVN
jgi:hypothetical protein